MSKMVVNKKFLAKNARHKSRKYGKNMARWLKIWQMPYKYGI
jgi:hypothetical protein